MEGLAAALAAERITESELEELERLLVQAAECAEDNDLDRLVEIDTAFHEVLYRASRNDRLVQIVSNLREQIQRFRKATLGSPGRMQETLAEHRKLVDALGERNAAVAQALAYEHIENAENRIFGSLVNREGEQK